MSAGSTIAKCAVGGALIGGVYGIVSDGKDTITCAFDGALIGAGVGVAIAALSTSAEEEDAGFFGLLSGSSDTGFGIGGDHMIQTSNSVVANYR